MRFIISNFLTLLKVDVNGPNTSPVFTFLKSALPGDIKWNFEKVS